MYQVGWEGKRYDLRCRFEEKDLFLAKVLAICMS